MYKSVTYLFLSLFLLGSPTLQSHAQERSLNQDSLTLVRKSWSSTTLKKGVTWKKAHFENLFGSQQQINVVEIDLRKHGKHIHLAAEKKILKKTSVFAKEHNAIVAINGGFFNMKDGGAVDFLRIHKEDYYHSKKVAGRNNAALAFQGKKLSIQALDNESIQEIARDNIMQAGPLLLDDHLPVGLAKNAFNDNRHPRTAIAVTADRTLLLITVDGRHAQAQGMSLRELAKVISWMGAKDAMNLDGGGSTAMYVRQASDSGIVNYPSDNKTFDHHGERAVANIIYLK